MVRRTRIDSPELEPPWRRAVAAPVAFVALWTTGADTTLDHLVRIEALREREPGRFEVFERDCAPSSAESARSNAAWRELEAFLDGSEVVVARATSFRPWCQHLRGNAGLAAALGVDEIAGLLLPSRARKLEPATRHRAIDVVASLAELVRRFTEVSEERRAMLAAAWTECHRQASQTDIELAERLERALELVDRPLRWFAVAANAGEAPREASLSACGAPEPDDAADFVRERIDDALPRWAGLAAARKEHPTVPVHSAEAEPLSAEDLTWIDEVFREHLPRQFQSATGEPSYRRGQHEVAAAVARALGSRKLLLVHAPTGTGKTLSYLVPALLWSVRNNVRVAVSTYTRALQEQALEHDVPRALAALERAALPTQPRVCAVKGRANYLCWRALRLHVPSEGDGVELWMAWTNLLAFAFSDDDGDLDRLPLRPALPGRTPSAYQRELDTLLRAARAQVGCCRAREDRTACAADVARQRAERSHLVVTNHAFALLQPLTFKHVVFDECEHLHDQAGNAWSWSVTLREVREFLVRLHQPGRPQSRAPLDRLERLTFEGDPSFELLRAARSQWFAALGTLDALQAAVERFKSWRDGERRGRAGRDEHSLLREFVALATREPAAGLDDESVSSARALIAAHGQLVQAGSELDAALAQIAGTLESLRAKGLARVRRALELARGDLMEWLEALRNWIPIQDGRPVFAAERFYDVEQDGRGDDLLVARVLLPNEILGRSYYPTLQGAVLISATTWLRGGFEVASAYLGLDRAAQPAEGEEREPCVVDTFRARDPFDYSRVLVCAPNDAPDPARERERFQIYVRRFVAHLAERTRGRLLVLFTNSDEARRTGEELTGFFRARGLPLLFQNMPGVRKEELGQLFRERVDSTLLGVDTFWFGADFPGETLEHLVIVKLPYGVPDRFHHAQCAALGSSEQRRRIYLPRALAKFRQGFGRLMRRESDRGCVYLLDPRITIGANRLFLGELPLASELGRAADDEWAQQAATLVSAPTDACLNAAFEHLGLTDEIVRRELDQAFAAPDTEESPTSRRSRPS